MHRMFLIRHGQSQTNAGGRNSDPKAVELTTIGNEQARRIAAFLKSYTSLNLIVTSSYVRTKQTAGPTIREFRYVPHKEWEVQEFTYLSPAYFGYSNIHERRPMVEAYWEQSNPGYNNGKGSETFSDFILRVERFITRSTRSALKTENLAIFSHEQFINGVLWCLKGRPTLIDTNAMRDFRHYCQENRISNGSIKELKLCKGQDGWTFELTGEHLKQPVHELDPDILANYVSVAK